MNDQTNDQISEDEKIPDRILNICIITEANLKESGSDLKNEFVKEDHSPGMPPGPMFQNVSVNSKLFGKKSSFFRKLLSYSWQETLQNEVTLHVDEFERNSFFELLEFISTNQVKIDSHIDGIKLLMTADKYDVPLCTNYCIEYLLRHMNSDSAMFYLEIPFEIEAINPLLDAAKSYLADMFTDLNRYEADVLHLPLEEMRAVLMNKNLAVESEDEVFSFLIKWTDTNCQEFEEKKEILSALLISEVDIKSMSFDKILPLLESNYPISQAAKTSIGGFLQKKIESEMVVSRNFGCRKYKQVPVKINMTELPFRSCTVYFDLQRLECKDMFPDGVIRSQPFAYRGEQFILQASISKQQRSPQQAFIISLLQRERFVDRELWIRMRPGLNYEKCYIGIPWISFISRKSRYFVNNIVHTMTIIRR